jgi:predicted GNAT family N-acyltransferase
MQAGVSSASPVPAFSGFAGPGEAIEALSVGIAGSRVADRELIPVIRKLLTDAQQAPWAAPVREVAFIRTASGRQFPSVAESLDWLSAAPSTRLLVATGATPQDFADHAANQCGEVVLSKPARGTERGLPPSPSSLLREFNLTITADLATAVRKALQRLALRGRGIVRLIDTCADMDRYLRLRYSVWKQQSYLNPDQIPQTYPVEVDYTDRTSVPVGMFSADGRIMACARLVREIGSPQQGYSRVIQELLDSENDAVAKKSFGIPRRLNHPFDLLEEFQGFHEYYSALVRARMPVGEVSRVIVDGGCRRQGIGEAMVDCVIDLAARLRLRRLFLACQERHVGLYRRSGFEVRPDVRSNKFLHIRQPSVLMEREVAK